MRRLADVHPGNAKTDARDAFVIADAALICLARRRSDVIHALLRDQQPYQPDRKNHIPAAQAT
jgi:hypothetical protein